MGPYRDDELLRSIRKRVATLLADDGSGTKPNPPASPEEIALTESELGFRLPRLLQAVYGIANGWFGPSHGLLPMGEGEGTLSGTYLAFTAPMDVPEPGEPGFDQCPWPERLLPILDWGCAIWSCLDCRSEDGLVVTASNGEPFASTEHTLRSWLSAWLGGTDLFEEMFEPGPAHTRTPSSHMHASPDR
jgi:hypothetical protein